jgi:hypothetical protein
MGFLETYSLCLDLNVVGEDGTRIKAIRQVGKRLGHPY